MNGWTSLCRDSDLNIQMPPAREGFWFKCLTNVCWQFYIVEIFLLSSYYLSMLMYSFNLCRSLIKFWLSKYYLKWKNWIDSFILFIYLSNLKCFWMFTNQQFQQNYISFMFFEPFDTKVFAWFKVSARQKALSLIFSKVKLFDSFKFKKKCTHYTVYYTDSHDT